MKLIVSHPTGNRNVRAVIESFLEKDLLTEFETTIATNSESAWIKFMPKGLKEEWLRRSYSLPHDKLWSHPLLELIRLVLPKMGLSQYVNQEYSCASIDSVYKEFDKAVARRLAYLVNEKVISAVYAYEDGALSTFKQAKDLGLACVYDLPIAYWETGRKLMLEEEKRLPEWAKTLGGGLKDSKDKLERKTLELKMSDIVICPSKFVEKSLPDWARKKLVVVSPFGSPEKKVIGKIQLPEKKISNNQPLRVLFVGSMGQRKGLGDLFAAVKLLNLPDTEIELVVMGSLLAPLEFYREKLSNFKYEPGRPHNQVLQLMRTCDIFCLPSIVEGRALVMQEAMSQGLPLIITPNTGGEDLIIEGKTGFLVPIRSPKAIANKLTWFLENRRNIPNMALMAQQHATRYTWGKYGETIVEAITTLVV